MTSSFRRSAVVISFDGAVDSPDAANGIGVTRLANKTYRAASGGEMWWLRWTRNNFFPFLYLNEFRMKMKYQNRKFREP